MATRDLSVVTGLPLGLDVASGALLFGAGVVCESAGTRTLDELRTVLMEPGADGPDPVYRLYRGVSQGDDGSVLRQAGLRYDLTVTLPGTIGGEYVKTAGHYHERAPDGTGYPEVYQVVHGRAAFVLQWVNDVEAAQPDVRAGWVASCVAGDKIVIPPDCGHVTVNIGDEPLVVADLVARDCDNQYGSFRHATGAAYYVVHDETTPERFTVKLNPRCRHVPAPVVSAGSRWSPFLPEQGPLYDHVRELPASFSFLCSPAARTRVMFALWRTPMLQGSTPGVDC